MNQHPCDLSISNLGSCTVPSPVSLSQYVSDEDRVLFNVRLHDYAEHKTPDGQPLSIELAGPRKQIFFDPSSSSAAIVTCGGICPGINDVIRSIVMELHHRYGVRRILGIRYGFRGMIERYGHDPIPLTPETVKDIHATGGSFLSSSRGKQSPSEMVDALIRMGIKLFFCIGGDGTMRAAQAITEEMQKRNLPISLVGIPKTIDNDLNLIQKTFGYDTAISEAVNAIRCAHVEAKGSPLGVGIVKIMGRQSGHIAIGAALAQNDANFVLIPEVPFDLDGEKGFLVMLEKRLLDRGHCVVLAAEGAGQELFSRAGDHVETDASGNIRLLDIGVLLKERIESHFRKASMEVNVKYIDPSYMIRSVPANASDSIYCGALGQYAVHAGMAGRTGMLVGLLKDEYVHLPLHAVTSGKKVDPEGNVWMRVLEATGQPASMKNS